MASGRLRPDHGFGSSVLGPACPCSCCCCHSSIFVSLCSACLKDCHIYLNFIFIFLFATDWIVCMLQGNGAANAFPPSRAHRHALQYTESLRPRILTSVFADFYVIHGHSPYAYAGKFTAWSKKKSPQLIFTDFGRDKPSRKLRNLCDFSYSFPLRWWKLSKHQSRNNREKNILPAAMNFNILFMFFICPKEYLLIPTFITLLKVVHLTSILRV